MTYKCVVFDFDGTLADTEEKAFNIFELSFYYSYSDSATAHNYLKQGLLYKNEFPVANGMGKVYEGLVLNYTRLSLNLGMSYFF